CLRGAARDDVINVEPAIEVVRNRAETRNGHQPPGRTNGEGRDHQGNGVNDAEDQLAGEIVREQVRQDIADDQLRDNRIRGKSQRQRKRFQIRLVKYEGAVVVQPGVTQALEGRERIPVEKAYIQDIEKRH